MRNQKGFTLIELVVVIVILGILAAVAVPKFIDIQVDARVAALKGMQGAVQGGASLAHAQQLVKGLDSNDSVTMDGDTVTMVNGYPTADAGGIFLAVDATSEFAGVAGSPFQIQFDGRDDCEVRYAASTDGSFPTITIESSGCN